MDGEGVKGDGELGRGGRIEGGKEVEEMEVNREIEERKKEEEERGMEEEEERGMEEEEI